MSSKKNSFSTSDRRFMKLALNLAKANLNLTGLNPSVGCVIVKNDEIISYGQTGLKGRPHAEYVAIKNCKKNLQNSTMYVSMEPCTHYGKTPPCTNYKI
jgi:diaminohydroxyphosphoribosylaminopyrimidine deaminase/5-amino-6-(5-phosphoribosylamino)uracil reductase